MPPRIIPPLVETPPAQRRGGVFRIVPAQEQTACGRYWVVDSSGTAVMRRIAIWQPPLQTEHRREPARFLTRWGARRFIQYTLDGVAAE